MTDMAVGAARVGENLHCGTVWPTGCGYHATEDMRYRKLPLHTEKWTLIGPPWENVSAQPGTLWFHYTYSMYSITFAYRAFCWKIAGSYT